MSANAHAPARRYRLAVGFSEADGEFVVTAPAFPGLSALAETPDEAVREALVALEGFIEGFQEDGWPLPEPDAGAYTPAPYSGRLNLRMPKSLHAALAGAAEEEGVSLNQLIVARLSKHGTL